MKINQNIKHNASLRPTALVSMLAVLCLLLAPAQTAYAATCETPPISIDWASIPWDETNVMTVEQNTFFDTSINAENPYHGLATALGGVSTFYSQTFNDIDGNGTDFTLYYSPNMYINASTLGTPGWYGPGNPNGTNPDERVTAPTAARMTNDRTADFLHPTHGNIATAATYVFSFSQPVLFQEFIGGSISDVVDYEHSVVRAFDDALAEGDVVKATKYNNISNISDDSTLIQQFGNPAGPITNNDFTNVIMDADYTYDGNGVGQGIGDAGDDGVYHTVGDGLQGDDRYGRVLLGWEDDPVQSIAMSTFVTATNAQADDDYQTGPASVIAAPTTFCVAAASTGPNPDPTPPPNEPPTGDELAPTGYSSSIFVILGFSLIFLAMSGLWLQRTSRTNALHD